MSTDRREREHSAGGVVVRGEDTIVIVPTRRTASGRQVLALPKGHVDPGESEVLLRITQSDIAQLAGSSRESASRFLAVLERAGILAQGRGRITVHDPEALRRYVY